MEFISLNVDLQQVLTTEQAWHYFVVPKAVHNNSIELYADKNKVSPEIKNELEVLLGKNIVLEITETDVIQKTLGKYYRKTSVRGEKAKAEFISLNKNDDFLISLIAEAKHLGSSDIHIEAYEDKCRIRIRIDGMLIERFSIARTDYPSLINKIKIKANLDISEKRLPQDGRIFFHEDSAKFDIRVSVLPTLHGEKIVLRLLSNDATNINIYELGFSEQELSDYLEGIKNPHGMVLLSGPTGSGKTTTLYATLKILNKEKTNILTIEDPIEYTLEGINQVQLKESIGLTFASALRTFLRQDPDIIMVGEIRDPETAQMAVRAALTGHLVLSTIHTNSAWGTISRLIDMGVPAFLLANTLNTSAAQRLLRLLCSQCKRKEPFREVYYPKNFLPPRKVNEHHVAEGCESCHYTGYRGRKAIYEVISMDYEMTEHIKNNNFVITPLLKQRQIRTLSENAFEMFERGDTTMDEVYPLLLNN